MNSPSHTSTEIRVHGDDSEDLPRLSRLDIDAVTDLAAHVLEREGITSGEVSIVFCGDERIATLNHEWLEREGPTDCIAFDLRSEEGSTVVEGEVYIDLAQAERQAPDYGVSIEEEIRRLIVHGLLHLLGYTDTGTRAEADLMRDRQEAIVAAWTVPVLKETG